MRRTSYSPSAKPLEYAWKFIQVAFWVALLFAGPLYAAVTYTPGIVLGSVLFWYALGYFLYPLAAIVRGINYADLPSLVLGAFQKRCTVGVITLLLYCLYTWGSA